MPVSREHVTGLFWNLLRRPPSEADIQAHTRANSVAELANAFAESHEFLSGMVNEVFRWWLKRPPLERELLEWVNNFRRLGQIEGMKHLVCCRESLRHCTAPGQEGSAIVPPDHFWSGKTFGNQLIRWFLQREPVDPDEGLRYALSVDITTGEFSGQQMYRMCSQEPAAIRLRVQRNYQTLLGREITPPEFVHWNALASKSIWLWQIASSPEGLAHGLTLSRQRSIEPMAVSNVPPAPEPVLAQVVPAGFFQLPPE